MHEKKIPYKIWWSNFVITIVTINSPEQEETYQEIHPCATSNKDREAQKDLQFKKKTIETMIMFCLVGAEISLS